MPAVKIGLKHQITIPKEVFDTLNLEAGDFLDPQVKDKAIVLIPQKLVPKDQEWFWTEEWQEMEKRQTTPLQKVKLQVHFQRLQMQSGR